MRRSPASPRRSVAALPVSIVLSLLVGCSGDDAATVTTTTVTTTTVTTTTVRPTTAAPPTAAPTTDAPTTSAAPTTTLAPTTTTVDLAALEADIRADFEAAFFVLVACLADPQDCDVGLIAAPGSEAERDLSKQMAELVSNNLAARLGSGPQAFRIISIELTPEGQAVVRACVTDGAVLYDLGAPDTPDDDIIVNDALNSYDNAYRMKNDGDGWRRVSVEQRAIYPGSATCDA